jgi:hypothetical protein
LGEKLKADTMKGVAFLLMMFLFSFGCSLLNSSKVITEQSKQIHESNTDLTFSEKKDMTRKSTDFVLYSDSMHRDYRIQFWPKGVFTFSAEKGFIGEADSILISGRNRDRFSYSGMTRFEETDVGKVEGKFKQRAQVVSNQQAKIKTGSVSWLWVFAGLFAAVICLWRYKN